MHWHMWWVNYFWLYFVLLVIFISLLVWYFYTKLSEKIQKDQKGKPPGKKILQLLNPTERKVIERLISFGGVALQSDLSREMNKLKVHRAVKNLEEKKIIEVLPKGRTRLIKISEEFKDIL